MENKANSRHTVVSATFKLAINLVNYLSVQAFASRLCFTEFTIGDRTVRELQHPKSRAEEIRERDSLVAESR